MSRSKPTAADRRAGDIRRDAGVAPVQRGSAFIFRASYVVYTCAGI